MTSQNTVTTTLSDINITREESSRYQKRTSRNTFTLTIACVGISTILGLLFALLLNSRTTGNVTKGEPAISEISSIVGKSAKIPVHVLVFAVVCWLASKCVSFGYDSSLIVVE